MRGLLQRRSKDIRGQLGQNGEILRWVCESGHGYRCNHITQGLAVQSQEVAASAFSVCRPSSAKAPISSLPSPFRITRWSGSPAIAGLTARKRSEEHTSELQSLMRTSYAVLCLKINIYRKMTLLPQSP